MDNRRTNVFRIVIPILSVIALITIVSVLYNGNNACQELKPTWAEGANYNLFNGNCWFWKGDYKDNSFVEEKYYLIDFNRLGRKI